jgi:hypothetical protein
VTSTALGLAQTSTEPVRATVEVLAPVSSTATAVHFDLNVLSDVPRPTTGSHFLGVYLVGPDDEVSLGQIDLANDPLEPNDNPLGFASGWKTVDLAIPAGTLKPGIPERIEFRFESDRDGTGETVAIALDRLEIEAESPSISVSSPIGDLGDGQLDFGTDTADPSLGIIHLDNQGTVPLTVDGLSIVGAGFELIDPPSLPLTVLPGIGLDLRIRRLNEGSSNAAKLVITSDDPDRPELEIGLAGAPANPPHVVDVHVNSGAAQRSNVEEIEVRFDEDVNITALIADRSIGQVVEIVRLTGSPSKVALGPDHYRWDAADHLLSIDLSIDGFGGSAQTLLADGRYELRIHSGSVTDSNGSALVDDDGIADGLILSSFHQLRGDLNGDAVVDARDLVIARNGMLGVLDHGLAVWADVDGDGKIDMKDYLAVKTRIGKKV